MVSTRSSLLLACAAFVHSVICFSAVSISSTVQADVDTQVTIDNDLSEGANSLDARYDSFGVFLAVTVKQGPLGVVNGALCVLINSTPINTTELTIKIPASVGPSGDYYSIGTLRFNSAESPNHSAKDVFSKLFMLEGGMGDWNGSSLSAVFLWDADSILCSSYGCARDCAARYHDTDSQGDCINSCPGVSQLPLYSTVGSATAAASTAVSTSSGSTPPASVTNSAVHTSAASSSTSATVSISGSISIPPTPSPSTGAAAASYSANSQIAAAAAFILANAVL